MNYLIKVYKLMTLFALIIFIISVTALDSESLIPTLSLIGSMIWLGIYVGLDNWFGFK